MSIDENFILKQCERELAGYKDDESEIVQGLLELGYLPVLQANSLTRGQIAKAIEVFEKDLQNDALFSKEEVEKKKKQGRFPFLRFFLRALKDIDEGIIFESLPERGAQNLTARIIHYRLDILGMWDHPVDTAFSLTSLQKLTELAELAQCEPLEAINHMADIENFTRHLLKTFQEEDFILTFKAANVKSSTKNDLDKRIRFGNQIKDDFGDKTDYLRYLRRNILNLNERRIDYDFLEEECKNKFKRLVIRLIQIHQWQEGFYDGLLDSNLGEISLQSILESIDAYNMADGKDIKPLRVITYLGRDYFMFNALFFLQEYMIEEREANEDEVWSSLSEKVKQADDDEQQKFEKNLKELKEDIDASPKPEEKKGLLKRIYFGIKKLIKKALRFITKIYKWVLDKVKKMWKFLKKLFKNFFEDLHEGLIAFIDGVKFLLGKKIIFTGNKVQYIASKYELTGDISTLAVNASQTLPLIHRAEAVYQLGALSFSIAVLGHVFKIILQSLNFLSWPFLLFTIVKSIKSIRKSYNSLENN